MLESLYNKNMKIVNVEVNVEVQAAMYDAIKMLCTYNTNYAMNKL